MRLLNNNRHITFILVIALFITFSLAVTHVYAGKSAQEQINKAIPLFLRKKYKAARKVFIGILKNDPNNIVARYYLAEIMFTDVRRYDNAAKQFKIVLKLKDKIKSKKFKIRNRYIFNNSVLKIGLVALKNGQNIKAIEYIKAFLKSEGENSPSRIPAYNSLAVAYSNMDDYENAIIYLEETINLDKDHLLAKFNLNSINSKLIYYNTGMDLSLKGKHIEAAREFVKSLDIDPFFVAAHYMLGLEHKLLRNYTDAENELLRAYAINPEYHLNYRVLQELADVYISLDEHGKARVYAKKSLGLNDKFPRTYNVLGKVYMHSGDYKKARDNFKKASDIRDVPEYIENLKMAIEALIKEVK